ncbi:MAG: hypothetical protein V7L25_09420 [Nostoc sp.]|uniref:hypothetical protein n=1 Tax=Nostoc sp. TaxID=1180 RepID=UPI002FF17489
MRPSLPDQGVHVVSHREGGNLRQALRLGAVAHGGNSLQPFSTRRTRVRHPTAGASLSLWEKTALLHRFASTLKKLTLTKS